MDSRIEEHEYVGMGHCLGCALKLVVQLTKTRDEQAAHISALQDQLHDANGQLGEFFNTPSGAIIKARDEEIEQLKSALKLKE